MIEGAAARRQDFGDGPARVTSTGGAGRAELRLAAGALRASGAGGLDKYAALERRRRRAQIAARHALDGTDSAGRPSAAAGSARMPVVQAIT